MGLGHQSIWCLLVGFVAAIAVPEFVLAVDGIHDFHEGLNVRVHPIWSGVFQPEPAWSCIPLCNVPRWSCKDNCAVTFDGVAGFGCTSRTWLQHSFFTNAGQVRKVLYSVPVRTGLTLVISTMVRLKNYDSPHRADLYCRRRESCDAAVICCRLIQMSLC